MVALLSTLLDEYGGSQPKVFWTNPDDYYRALNEAQTNLVQDAANGSSEDWRIIRGLVVSESLADTATLTYPCLRPLSAWDVTNSIVSVFVQPDVMRAYKDCALAAFSYFRVESDKLVTAPASQTLTLNYVKYPVAITASVDSPVDVVAHPIIVEMAREIMLRKDIATPLSETIENERNKLDIFKQAKAAGKQSGYAAREVPYSNR
jgi:hypothetical protein